MAEAPQIRRSIGGTVAWNLEEVAAEDCVVALAVLDCELHGEPCEHGLLQRFGIVAIGVTRQLLGLDVFVGIKLIGLQLHAFQHVG